MPSKKVLNCIRTLGTFLIGVVTGMILIHSFSSIDVPLTSPLICQLSHWQDDSPNKTLTLEEDSQSGEENLKDVYEWKDDNDESHKRQDDSVAVELKNKMRILCWILTSPENLVKRAIHVNATWGHRCTTLLFISSKSSVPVQTALPVVEMNVPEGHHILWRKTNAAMGYIHDRYINDIDWILKTDDDTFVIMENLRYLLKDHSPDDPKFFGRRFKTPYLVNQTYMSGGAGYVLSRAALRLFVTCSPRNANYCSAGNKGSEDIMMGKCLQRCGVEHVDTRDTLGRQRFIPVNPSEHLMKGLQTNEWIRHYDYYPASNGPDCCSDYAITFHYVKPHEMYTLEYFIYHMKPYGIAINYEKQELIQQNQQIDNTKK